eukprot:jgi/Undpi1/10632/HiC_scaffold_29.g13082.m1
MSMGSCTLSAESATRDLMEEDDAGGAESGSSGASFLQHDVVSDHQVAMETQRPTMIRCKGSPLLDTRSSLTAMPLHVFELTMQQAAEQGQWPEASPGNGRRRNRNWTKRKKALAAAAARRATRDPALCLLASRCLQGGDVAKGSALSHVEKEIGVASSPTRSSVVAESPSPGKGKRLATGLQNRTRASFRQHRYLLAAIIDRHSWCSDAVAILPCGVVDDECEILVKTEGEGIAESSAVDAKEKVGETSTSTISSESISLQLPEPATIMRAEIIAAAVESIRGHAKEGVVGARAESGEGSTTCPSIILELLLPAGSSIVEATTTSEMELGQEAGRVEVTADRTTATLSTSCDVEFPPQPVESIVTCYAIGLIEELEAKIARRGDREVVVEGVGMVVGAGAVEGESRRREQTDQDAKVLVPTTCERRPGDLRALFLRNLAKVKEGGAIDGACKVTVAQNALVDLCQLEVVGPLGEGASGTVSAVCSAIVPGKFALKEVREGRGQRAIDNAMAEISVLARLSGVPHPNVVIIALAANDSQISKSILLPIAECDFDSVLTESIWTKPELFRQVGAAQPNMVGSDRVSHCGLDLGDIRPQMTGTVGYMPLECMQGPVAVSANQDVFSLAAMTWDFCAVSNKKRPNMFAHPDLYTERERKYMVFLGYTTAPSQVADRLLRYEWKVTARVLEDGSYTKLLNKESLSEDLGTKGREAVSDYLPWLLSKDPADRPSLASFQSVMDLFAEKAKNETAVEA